MSYAGRNPESGDGAMDTRVSGGRLAQPDGSAPSARFDAPLRSSDASAAASMSLTATVAIFALAFLVPAWPWLSGRVTIPWDAKSQFYPQLEFLATAIARGEWPWWTPNVFAGWPQISDPQSLIFSPLHALLAVVTPAIGLRAFDAVTFAYLFLGGLGEIGREIAWMMPLGPSTRRDSCCTFDACPSPCMSARCGYVMSRSLLSPPFNVSFPIPARI